MELRIDEKDKALLLSEARETIAAELEGRKPRYGGAEPAPGSALGVPCGAFVSIHEGRSLRGCIGRMTAAKPLRETVRDMARAAAFEDPRFPPLSAAELPRCSLEISALSPLEECPDPREVVVGVHGVYLIARGRSGVLLPQVPVEQGWDREEYLDYLCRKAGLESGAYRESGARLLTFTAAVFSEPKG